MRFLFQVAAVCVILAGMCWPMHAQVQQPIDNYPTPVDDDANYKRVPGGKRFHKSCIHEIPDGAVVEGKSIYVDGKLVNQVQPCGHPPRTDVSRQLPTLNGWIETAVRNATPFGGVSWYNQIWTTWTVPSIPAITSPQLLYFFNGLQGSHSILQPVLQWGFSPAGGGPIWAMANWLVYADGTAFHDSIKGVFPGDTITGYVQLDTNIPCSASGMACFYKIGYMTRNGQNSQVTFAAGDIYNQAVDGTLEAYNLTTCDQLPRSSTWFSNVMLLQAGPTATNFNFITPSWTPMVFGGSPSCGYQVIPQGTSVLFLW
jgi:hypothetical protein